jgi:hypothetical protein
MLGDPPERVSVRLFCDPQKPGANALRLMEL